MKGESVTMRDLALYLIGMTAGVAGVYLTEVRPARREFERTLTKYREVVKELVDMTNELVNVLGKKVSVSVGSGEESVGCEMCGEPLERWQVRGSKGVNVCRTCWSREINCEEWV